MYITLQTYVYLITIYSLNIRLVVSEVVSDMPKEHVSSHRPWNLIRSLE